MELQRLDHRCGASLAVSPSAESQSCGHSRDETKTKLTGPQNPRLFSLAQGSSGWWRWWWRGSADTPRRLLHSHRLLLSRPSSRSHRSEHHYQPPRRQTHQHLLASACAANYDPDFNAVFSIAQGDSLIVGDWNAHHEAWYSEPEDRRGEALAEAIEGSDLCVLNHDTPTRIPLGSNNNQRSSSPDISIISAHLALAVSWSPVVHLSSDHLPIIIALNDDTPVPCQAKTYVNFNKADWPKFNAEAERLVSQLPTPSSCSSGEKLLREAVLAAAKHHIPAGYRKDFTPGRNAEVDALQKRYDEVRTRDPRDPSLEQIEGDPACRCSRISAALARLHRNS